MKKRNNYSNLFVFQSNPQTLPYLHTAPHACGGSVVQAAAVVVVSGIDIGLFILASLQPGPSPAQNHLAEEYHSITLLSLNFANMIHIKMCLSVPPALHSCLYLQAV